MSLFTKNKIRNNIPNFIQFNNIDFVYPISFLSYAKEDHTQVIDFYNKFKKANLNPWIDEHNLNPGSDWELCIKQIIQKSRLFIPFLSNNSVNKKGFVQKEINI